MKQKELDAIVYEFQERVNLTARIAKRELLNSKKELVEEYGTSRAANLFLDKIAYRNSEILTEASVYFQVVNEVLANVARQQNLLYTPIKYP